jgi:hypothetical protein
MKYPSLGQIKSYAGEIVLNIKSKNYKQNKEILFLLFGAYERLRIQLTPIKLKSLYSKFCVS